MDARAVWARYRTFSSFYRHRVSNSLLSICFKTSANELHLVDDLYSMSSFLLQYGYNFIRRGISFISGFNDRGYDCRPDYLRLHDQNRLHCLRWTILRHVYGHAYVGARINVHDVRCVVASDVECAFCGLFFAISYIRHVVDRRWRLVRSQSRRLHSRSITYLCRYHDALFVAAVTFWKFKLRISL